MALATSTTLDLHFDINDYLERLTPSKKNRYHCPICNSPKFSIKKGSAGYRCWEGDCDGKEIELAIRPATEVKQLLEADRERKRKTPVPYSLSAAHLKEMSLSGIPEGLARMNIRSVEDSHQIAEFLDWKGYMGTIGWLYTGVDPDTGFDTGIGQFKPDEKFAFPNGNLAKYLSQKHAYDAACFRIPCWVLRKIGTRYGVLMPEGIATVSDLSDVTAVFWRWVIDNPQLPISPAEGGKKALLLLAEGRIGISISGVDMATIGRGVDLVPTLKKLAVKGRPVEPFYDADIIEKPDVENALMAFGAALTRAGCVITVPTWELELGKGVDDLAVNEGENWESCLTVLSYKDWLKKLEQQRQTLKKRSPVKKTQTKPQGRKTGNVDVPANLKVLQITPTEYLAGQHLEAIHQILSETPVNEPVVPLIFDTEEDAEFARQYSIGSIATADDKTIQRTIGQLQIAGCRAVTYFASSNKDVERLLVATCDQVGIACAVIDSELFYPDIQKGDIRQILTTMNADEFIQRIEDELHSRAQEDKEHRENLTIGDDDGGKDGKKKGKDLPPPSVIADELAEIYRGKLAWESEYQQWRHYGAKHDGAWDVETTESVKALIHTYLRSQGLLGFNSGYISSIATILQSDVEVRDWNEQVGLIPLRDGVLNQLTQELKPHAPGYRFTYQLPFKWADRLIGCQPIEEFLLKITGNQAIADVLLAYLSAIVTRRSDLQRYLEIKGGGGTGKSTYMTLARDLVGADNTVSSQLKHLENNQFETAKFYGKSLALFPDSERWQGEVSVLKQLTGQDPIRYERKGVQQCKDFIFKGMAMLSANEAPESRDLTSGQERRKLTIELDIKVPEYADRELSKEFQPYLPGLLKRVLDISAEEVTRLIKHTDREVPALAQVKWKQLCETNPIAGWLEEKAVINPEAKGYIGLGDIDQAGRWLYANFIKYQQDNGHKNSVSMKRFSLNLRDLLKNQMKVAIAEGRDRDGSYLYGVGLRCQLDPAGERYPCPVTKKPFCDGFVMVGDGSVTVETLTDVGFDGYAGFSENLENKTNNQFDNAKNQCEETSEILASESCAGDDEEKSSNPSNPTSASIPTVTNPSQTHHKPAVISSEPINLLVEIVRTAQTWAEVKSAWNGNEDLKRQIKGQLSDTELKRIGKLCKQAQSDASESGSSTAAE